MGEDEEVVGVGGNSNWDINNNGTRLEVVENKNTLDIEELPDD